MIDGEPHDARLFAALFALMYDHFMERPAARADVMLFRWIEPRANLARFDSMLSREDAQRALGEELEEHEAEAAFVLLYEGCARYRAGDYLFTAEDMHHLFRARKRFSLTADEALAVIDAREESTRRQEGSLARALI